MHIAICGNIGSGKTTLTELLSKQKGWEPHYEEVDENPYLIDFYDDMQRYAFNLQIYFLYSRFNQVLKINNTKKTIIQDRTIYEDSTIFAANLHSMGLMLTRDYDTYQKLFEAMISMIKPPDLLIYLRATVPTLVSQIQKRGRKFESSIRLDYLQRLNERYEAWIENYTMGNLLIIDVDNHKFADSDKELSYVLDKIDAQLNGLFK